MPPALGASRPVMLPADETENSAHSGSGSGRCRRALGVDSLRAAPGCGRDAAKAVPAAQSGLLCAPNQVAPVRSEISQAADPAAGLGKGGLRLSLLSLLRRVPSCG